MTTKKKAELLKEEFGDKAHRVVEEIIASLERFNTIIEKEYGAKLATNKWQEVKQHILEM